MQTKSVMKNLFISSIVGCMLVVACETKSKMDSTEVAEEKNEAKFEGTKENDAEFITDISKGNLCEIESSALAIKKAKSKDVIAFATMMVEHHTAMQNDVKIFASKKNISIPDTIAQNEISSFSALKDEVGNDFDKKYIDAMVDDHKKTIDKLEDVSKSDKYDQEVVSMAAQTLPKVRTHYDQAVSLQTILDNKKK